MADPILQQLLAAKNPDEKAAIVAEARLGELAEDTALVARRCVIVHWFDRAIVTALAPEDREWDVETIYEALATLPYSESVAWGLAYHGLTRQGLLQRYGTAQPELLRAAAGQAATAYWARREDRICATGGLFCLLAAGETRLAREALTELFARALSEQDMHYLANLIAIQDEAEALPWVARLERSVGDWMLRGVVRAQLGDLAGAVADSETAAHLEPGDPDYQAGLVGAYVDAGQTERAREVATEVLLQLPEDDYYGRACIGALMGDRERALGLLQKSLEKDPSMKVWARMDPDFRSLRLDARYRELVGLPVETES
jgi:tetratricopeptide (TPR) repeat protein